MVQNNWVLFRLPFLHKRGGKAVVFSVLQSNLRRRFCGSPEMRGLRYVTTVSRYGCILYVHIDCIAGDSDFRSLRREVVLMKKAVLFAVAAILCVTAFVIMSDSADAAGTGGTCGDNLTWGLSDDGTLTISGTGKMKDFDDSHGSSVNFSPWDKTTVKKIVIESGVTSIGNNAFSCIEKYVSVGSNGYFLSTALISVTIPESVTSIGDYAFAGCTKLTSVSGDLSGVTSIGTYAFAYCPLGTSDEPCTLDLSKVTSIGSCAFYQCSGLGSVTLGNSLTTLGNSAFQGTALTTVTIPDTVTSIEANLFWNCTSLTEVKFNSNITSIGSYAFSGCTSLTSVGNLTNVTKVGQCTFMDTALTSVTFGDSFVSFNNDGSNGSAFKNCKSLETVTLGKNVKAIGPEEFSGCISLKTIGLSNVTSVGKSAFNGCVALTSVNLGKVTAIGQEAFSGCTSLTSVGDLTNVKTIGSAAFENTAITSITIPNAVKSIEGSTFKGCASLTEVNFNSNITSIGAQAFSGCTSLTSMGDLTNVTSIGWGAFKGTALASVELGTGITAITDGVFKDCTKLTSVTGLANVTSIGGTTFNGCTSLTSISFGDNLATLGKSAFNGCTALTSVTGLANVTSIGDAAFNGCTSLTSISFGDNLTTLGESIFYGCTSLGSVTLGTGVTTIPKETFCNCSKLTSVIGLSEVTSVGNTAFNKCESLTSVTFGTLTSIGNNAFSGCTSLTSVGDLSKVTTIGTSAFYSCSKLTSVTFGNNLTSIGQYAFRGCTALTSVTVGDGDASSVEGFTIGIYAFNGCTSLKSVAFKIPRALTSVGSYAFTDCTSLKEVTVNFTAFDSTVFSGNKAITKVTFGSNCASVGAGAFKNCTALSTAIFESENEVTIGESAFEGCFQTECPDHSDSWGECVYGSGSAVIGNSAFKGCTWLHSMYFDSGVASVGDSAFEGCTAFVGFDMSNTETIGAKAFKGCISLDGICINFTKSIGDSAFEGCTALTSFSNPDSPEGSEWTLMVTTIGANAFKGCSKLTSLIFWLDDTGPLTIGESAFSGCTGLTSITFEYYDKTEAANESVTVGANAFSGCISLASMTFSSDIKSMAFAVDGTPFSGCAALGSVSIPGTCTGSLFVSSVTYIFADGSRTVVQRDSDGKLMADEPAPTSGGSKCSYHWVKDGIAVPVTGNVDYSETDEHELNHVEATNPACSKNGNKEYWYCSFCGKKFSDSAGTTETADVVIAATGHEYKEVAAKAATSDTPGNIKYWKCEKCTEVFKYDDKSPTSVIAVTTYLVRFMNDSEQVSSKELLSGEAIEVPADQTKNADSQYTYTWSGWSVDQKTKVTPSAKATKCVTYYALYDKTVNKHAVIFMNGDTELQNTEVECGVSPEYTGDEPTKKKTDEYTYKFLGWSLKSDGIGNTYDATSTLPTVEESVTYYAVFKEIANEYTVNYLVDDKAVEGYSDETHVYNSEVTVLGAYTKTGYTVTEWKAEGITVTDGKFTMPAKDVTFTATSTINSYTLTVKYVFEDNTEAATIYTGFVTYNSGYSVTSPAVTGYTADQLTVSGTMPADNVEVLVTYKANTYKVTVNYVYSDGTTASETKTVDVKYKDLYTVKSPAVEGYTADQLTVSGTMPAKNVDVTVTYNINSYTATVNYFYIKDNAEVSPARIIDLKYNESYEIVSPVIAGYTADKPVVSGTMGSRDFCVSVFYTINQYTVTFDSVGGTPAPAAVKQDYNTAVSEPDDVVKTGYAFRFWSKDGSTAYNFSTPITEDITLSAVWVINQYTITFDSVGGTPVPAVIKQDYGTAVTAPTDAVTKTGYEFKFWSADGETEYTFNTMPAENITLSAVWEAKKFAYTVKYRDAAGNKISDDKTGTAFFGTEVDAELKVIPGYSEPSAAKITITNIEADNVVTYTYTALEYTVTFMNDGAEFYKCSLKYGSVPSCSGTPGKNADNTNHYTFKGWSLNGTDVVNLTDTTVIGNVTYTAVFGSEAHTLTAVTSKEATCTEPGITDGSVCSVCGKVLSSTSTTPALGHEKTHHEAVAAKCTEDGTVEYWSCSRCSKNFSDEDCTKLLDSVTAPKTGHSMTYNKAKDATCTEDGNIEHYHCSSCNKNFADKDGNSEINGNVVIGKIGHSMIHHSAESATCTKDGNVEYYHCSNCNKNFGDNTGTNVIDNVVKTKTGHTEEILSGKAATCTETGLTEGKKCSSCGEILTVQETIPANGHSYGTTEYKWTDFTACTATKTCTVCGHAVTDEGTVTSEVTAAATCTITGIKTYTATFSEGGFAPDTRTEAIEKIAHDYADATYSWSSDCSICTASKKCKNCADIVTETVNSVSKVTKTATCTEEGVTTYAATFTEEGFSEQNKTSPIAKVDHKLEKVSAKEATCTESGNNEYYSCSVCNKVFKTDKTTESTLKAETLGALGHIIVADAAVPATVSDTGKTAGSHCSVCNDVIVAQKVIPKLEEGTKKTVLETANNVVEVSKKDIENLGDLDLEIKNDKVSVELPASVVKNAVGSVTDEGAFSISLETVASSDIKNDAVKEAVKESDMVISVGLTVGNTKVSNFSDNVTFSVNYTVPEGKKASNLYVGYVHEDGTVDKINCSFENGVLTFTTDHFSYYAVMYAADAPAGGSDNGSGNSMIIIIAVVAVIAVIGVGAFVFFKMRAKTN